MSQQFSPYYDVAWFGFVIDNKLNWEHIRYLNLKAWTECPLKYQFSFSWHSLNFSYIF